MECFTLADLQELKSFHSPPPLVKLVVCAILALFGEEETWYNGKRFLNDRRALIHKLSCFDVKSITPDRARRVEAYLNNRSLSSASIRMASVASYDLWMWVNEVYQIYKSSGGESQSTPRRKKKVLKKRKKTQTRPRQRKK